MHRLAPAVILLFAFAVVAHGAPPLRATIERTGAIVEGTVRAKTYSYSEAEGPRINVELSNVVVHAGVAPRRIRLRFFGGPVPDGRFLLVAGSPTLEVGSRYLVFLSGVAWRFSPVAHHLALRVDRVGGRQLLLSDEGTPVAGVSERAIEFSPTPLFERADPLGDTPAKRLAGATTDVARLVDKTAFLARLRRLFPRVARGLGGRFSTQPSVTPGVPFAPEPQAAPTALGEPDAPSN